MYLRKWYVILSLLLLPIILCSIYSTSVKGVEKTEISSLIPSSKSSSEKTKNILPESSNIVPNSTSSKQVQEPTPEAKIDYRRELLTNLQANTNYKLNEQEIISDKNGNIPIDMPWFGKELHIIKKGTDPVTTDSNAQLVYIPQRPNISIKLENMVVSENSIIYKDALVGVNYKINDEGAKSEDGRAIFENLKPGTNYKIEATKTATDTSFAAKDTVDIKTKNSSNSDCQKIVFGGVECEGIGPDFLQLDICSGRLRFTELRGTFVHDYFPGLTYFQVSINGKVVVHFNGDSHLEKGKFWDIYVNEGDEISIYHAEIMKNRWTSTDPDLSLDENSYNGSHTQTFHFHNGRLVHDWQVMPPTLNPVKDSDTELTGHIPRQSVTYGRSYKIQCYINKKLIGEQNVQENSNYVYHIPPSIELHDGDEVKIQLRGTSTSGYYPQKLSDFASRYVTTQVFVSIPRVYSLSNDKRLTTGNSIKLLDENQNPYKGNATVDVTISSKNNFIFDNYGEYQLVYKNGQKISSPIRLSKKIPVWDVNALLIKVARVQKSSTDELTFNYSINK